MNLLVFEKKSCKMSKNWTFQKNFGLGLNFTYDFEVCCKQNMLYIKSGLNTRRLHHKIYLLSDKTSCYWGHLLYLLIQFTEIFFSFTLTLLQMALWINRNKPAAQAVGQTLLNATPPVGKIHPFSKIAVTFEPIQQFRWPSIFRKKIPYSLFYDWKHHFNRFGVTAP